MKLSCVCLPDRIGEDIIQKLMDDVSLESDSKASLAFPPHFSIRGDFKIAAKDFDKLLSELEIALEKFKKISVQSTSYGFYPWKLVYLAINVSKQLRSLHEKCLQTIEDYRLPWIPEQYVNSNHFSGKQLEYIKKYGYHFCHEFFSPHFTLAGTDMTAEKFQQIQEKLSNRKVNFKFQVESLAFFDRDNGNEVIGKIGLRPKSPTAASR